MRYKIGMHYAITALSFVVLVEGCGGTAKPTSKSALPNYAECGELTHAIVTIDSGPRAGVGFLVDRSGLIATSLHTIAGEANIRVILYDDPAGYPVTAIVGFDVARDLALLRIDAKNLRPIATLGDSSTAAIGQHLCALTAAGPSDGVITNVRTLSLNLVVFTIKTSNPEQWQGALFNGRGEIIAIATAFLSAGDRSVIAVPTNYLHSMLQRPTSVSPVAFASQTTGIR